MATYRSIAATETDPQAPVTAALMKALDMNVDATAEGATGAPVLSATWHPFDMINVGDGATGLLYDRAVDAAAPTVTTPTFEDGYDYLIRLIGLAASSTAAFQIASVNVVAGAGANPLTGDIEIIAPRLTNYPKRAMVHIRTAAGSAGPVAFNSAAALPFYGLFNFNAMAGALSSVTVGYGATNITAGQVLLYRRRNFMFG